jgi:hypothetical protein
MESSTTAKAAAYLNDFPAAVVPREAFEYDDERRRGDPLVLTSATLSTHSRGMVLKTKIINSSKDRGLILRFFDYLIPRPFSKLANLELVDLAPEFKKYEILEAPGGDIVVVLNTCLDFSSEFGYDWMGKHIATITWKLHEPNEG